MQRTPLHDCSTLRRAAQQQQRSTAAALNSDSAQFCCGFRLMEALYEYSL
ncbi:MAG TPA: hypothetical protein VF600_17285 [Abditibacteriaceae bacterium]